MGCGVWRVVWGGVVGSGKYLHRVRLCFLYLLRSNTPYETLGGGEDCPVQSSRPNRRGWTVGRSDGRSAVVEFWSGDGLVILTWLTAAGWRIGFAGKPGNASLLANLTPSLGGDGAAESRSGEGCVFTRGCAGVDSSAYQSHTRV